MGNFSKVICCQAFTSWFVLVQVTPSNWSLFTKFSSASFTELAFCIFEWNVTIDKNEKVARLWMWKQKKWSGLTLTSMFNWSVKNGCITSVERLEPSRCRRDLNSPRKISLTGVRPKSADRVTVPLFLVPINWNRVKIIWINWLNDYNFIRFAHLPLVSFIIRAIAVFHSVGYRFNWFFNQFFQLAPKTINK